MENHLNLEYRNGKNVEGEWLWPAEDQGCWRHLNKLEYYSTPYRVADICNSKKLIIQAGGNCGVYPKQYSKLFETVITAEPDFRNFYCLCHNVPDQNVFKFQACLGNSNNFVGVSPRLDARNEINVGGLQISSQGNIPQITIDSLGVNPDVIQLDIEGYEGFALLGATDTIARSTPLIVLETDGNGTDFGWSQDRIDNLLFSWGYEIHSKVSKLDTAYIHKDKK